VSRDRAKDPPKSAAELMREEAKKALASLGSSKLN